MYISKGEVQKGVIDMVKEFCEKNKLEFEVFEMRNQPGIYRPGGGGVGLESAP